MLREPFLAHAGSRRAELETSGAELETLLEELLQAGRAAWPGVDLAPEVYLGHLAERLPAEGAALEALRAVHATDLYLACACSRGDRRALDAFEQRMLAPMVQDLDRGRAFAVHGEEIKQALRARLLVAEQGMLPKIGGYTGQGPLAAWVRIAAARMAIDLRRTQKEHLTFQAEAPTLLRAPGADPEIAYLKSRYAAELEAAFRSTLTSLPARERTILRLYFLDGVPADAISATYQVSSRTVQRWIAQARDRILDETRRLLGEKLQVSPLQLDTLIGLLQSQLDANIVEVLKKQEP